MVKNENENDEIDHEVNEVLYVKRLELVSGLFEIERFVVLY